MPNDFIVGLEILLNCKKYIECRVNALSNKVAQMKDCGKETAALEKEIVTLQKLLAGKEIDFVNNDTKECFDDCNKCPYLNITEDKQNTEFILSNIKRPHYCLKYNKRIFHERFQGRHLSKITPCIDCIGNCK